MLPALGRGAPGDQLERADLPAGAEEVLGLVVLDADDELHGLALVLHHLDRQRACGTSAGGGRGITVGGLRTRVRDTERDRGTLPQTHTHTRADVDEVFVARAWVAGDPGWRFTNASGAHSAHRA